MMGTKIFKHNGREKFLVLPVDFSLKFTTFSFAAYFSKINGAIEPRRGVD